MVVKKRTHWEGVPNVNANAAITEIRKVKGKLTIEVTAAYLRTAKDNNVLEIANTEMLLRIKKSELTVGGYLF